MKVVINLQVDTDSIYTQTNSRYTPVDNAELKLSKLLDVLSRRVYTEQMPIVLHNDKGQEIGKIEVES